MHKTLHDLSMFCEDRHISTRGDRYRKLEIYNNHAGDEKGIDSSFNEAGKKGKS
jgi:hypothetical protein